MELEAALARPGVRVVPVLVQGTEMPAAEQLPDSLKEFARRNALEMSRARWSYDLGRLIRAIDGGAGGEGVHPRRPSPEPAAPPAADRSRLPLLVGLGALVAVAATVGILAATGVIGGGSDSSGGGDSSAPAASQSAPSTPAPSTPGPSTPASDETAVEPGLYRGQTSSGGSLELRVSGGEVRDIKFDGTSSCQGSAGAQSFNYQFRALPTTKGSLESDGSFTVDVDLPEQTFHMEGSFDSGGSGEGNMDWRYGADASGNGPVANGVYTCDTNRMGWSVAQG
jgi:hypothetical protein